LVSLACLNLSCWVTVLSSEILDWDFGFFGLSNIFITWRIVWVLVSRFCFCRVDSECVCISSLFRLIINYNTIRFPTD
jgi:hypothetical protein